MIERWLRPFRKAHCGSVRVDETYVRIRGEWRYLYRAIGKHGKAVDFLLTAKRDLDAAIQPRPRRAIRSRTSQPHGDHEGEGGEGEAHGRGPAGMGPRSGKANPGAAGRAWVAALGVRMRSVVAAIKTVPCASTMMRRSGARWSGSGALLIG